MCLVLFSWTYISNEFCLFYKNDFLKYELSIFVLTVEGFLLCTANNI